MRDEVAFRFKKVRFESNGGVNRDRLRRSAELLKFRHDVLLLRGRKIQLRLGAKMVGKKSRVVINREPLDGLFAKLARIFIHRRLVRIEIPSAAADQHQNNDKN